MPLTAGLIGLVVVAALGLGPTLTDEEALAAAERAYAEALQAPTGSLASHRLFAQAAGRLEVLRSRGVYNPALFVNLAQAYLLAEDIPHAILACRRGLDLEPGHSVLQQLLDDARNQVDYPTYGAFAKPPVDDWPLWLPRLSLALRLALTVFCHALACMLLARWRMVRRGHLLAWSMAALAAAALLGYSLAQEQTQRAWGKAHPLVVVISDTRVLLHKGDGARYPCYNATAKKWEDMGEGIPPSATPLKPGVEARMRFDKGDWLQIELASGEVGWVRRSEVLMDEPSTP